MRKLNSIKNMLLKDKSSILFIFFFLSFLTMYSQDEIIYKNKPAKFVDKILDVKNDSLHYSNFKKKKSIPLIKLTGYYITVNTEENLKKRFFKRSRTYYPIKNNPDLNNSKRNPNKKYIDKKLKTLEKFNTDKFKKGYFAQGQDTTFCRILENNKKGSDNYLFIITLNDEGIKKAYTANEVDFYFVNNTLYYSYNYEDDNIKTTFFLKLLEKGKVILYECNSIPSHNNFSYYIKKEKEPFFYVISPYSESVEINQTHQTDENNESYSRFFYKSNNQSQEFKKAINKLFGTCISIKNKVTSGFYTKNDIPIIIKEYNNCR